MKIIRFLSIPLLLLSIYSCQPGNSSDPSAGNEKEGMAESDTLPYELITYSDTLQAKPGDANAPTASFSETWLIPKSDDEALNRFIFTALKDEMVFEAGAVVLENTKAAFDENKSWFFSQFKEAYGEYDELMGYDSESGMLVELNTGKWLTVMISKYSFTGGAHGNYGSSYVTLDIENKKKLYLEDVFKPNYEAVVTPILEKKVREFFDMEPDAPLEEFLFENKIPVTENFGLLKEGIIFDYPPYVLASYAAGEISLFISYEDLADILLIDPPK